MADVKADAYPTTFAIPQGSFSAERLVKAETLFRQHCAECHGDTGDGHGPLMQQAMATAADLTAAHTKDHTAGDMYWWISHGQPSGLMPGFADRLSDGERWDLVNYVRLLTLSAQSVELGDVEPLKPWLPSIDLSFTDADGNYRTLRDFQRSPILLVLAREERSSERIAEIASASAAIERQGLSVIVICGHAAMPSARLSARLIFVAENTEDVFQSWSYYRRTRSIPDFENRDPFVGHMEFLIDAHGYVRARWRSDDGLFPSVQEVLRQAALLNEEPQILPPPDEHVH